MSEDVRSEDALEVAQRALAKVNEQADRIDALEDEVDELEAELTKALARAGARDDELAYHELSKNQKVGMVREALVERAEAAPNDRAAMDYDDVMWSVFDGQPSADHCYDLMRQAASMDGFTVRDPSDGNRSVRVDLDDAKRSLAFSSANNRSQEEAGRE